MTDKAAVKRASGGSEIEGIVDLGDPLRRKACFRVS
jgi:hypothetical protein